MLAVRILRLPLFLALLAALANGVAADFMNGVQAYTQGDYQTAFTEFKALAEQGHLDAQNNLGVMYNTGKGVAADNGEAARWYRRAAERGHKDAQSNLAALYASGEGVPQDYVMAYAWFNQAASQGDDSARQNRDFIAKRLTPEQIDRAQRLQLLVSPAPTATTAAAPPPAPVPQAAPSPAPPPVTAPQSRAPAPANLPGQIQVQRGMTLWSIAERVKPNAAVSTQQTALALMRINPNAFSRPSDANSLLLGATLQLPSLAEINRLSQTEALSEWRKRIGR